MPNAGAGAGLNGSYSIDYHYDLADHVTAVDYPDMGGLPAETVTTKYSDQGLITKVSGSLGTYLNNVTYDDYGRVTSRSLGISGTDTSLTRSLAYGWTCRRRWDRGSRRSPRARPRT